MDCLSSPAETPPQHKCTKPAGIVRQRVFVHVRRRRGLRVVTAAAFLVELLDDAATVVVAATIVLVELLD